MIRASPRDGLDTCHALLRDDRRVAAKDETRGGRSELGKTSDGKVFMIHRRVVHEDFGGLEIRGTRRVSQFVAYGRVSGPTFLTTGSTHGLLLSSR